MSRKAGNSAKAERDRLRDQMRALGCTVGQIAVEMGRRFNLRPRVAWRYALGWPQWKLAQRYNTVHPGARLADNRVSEFEAWPHGGSPPSLRYLAQLAATFGHGCTPALLVDAEDLEHLLLRIAACLPPPCLPARRRWTPPSVSRCVSTLTPVVRCGRKAVTLVSSGGTDASCAATRGACRSVRRSSWRLRSPPSSIAGAS
jgi:hypothetical protein